MTTFHTLTSSGIPGDAVTDGDKGDVVVTSSGTVWTLDSGVVTAFARTVLDDVSASAVRTTLGLGTAALSASGDFATSGHTHSDVTSGGASGFISGADKAKLDAIAAGATVNSADATLLARANHTGTQAISTVTGLQAAIDLKLNASAASVFGLSLLDDLDASTARTTLGLGTAALSASGDFAATSHSHANAIAAGAAGFMTGADKTKLDGVAAGATVNSSDATLLARANHTGTQSADTLTDGTTNKAYTAVEQSKLAGVASGATANDTDANLKARANHTGTQAASTISDFTEASQDVVGAMIAAAGGSYDDTAGTIVLPSGGTPGGSTTQLQYNNAGAFGGTSGITTNGTKLAIASAANESPIAVTGYSLTGTDASSLLDLAGTWNTTGTPTAIKLAITDTASNSASNFLEMRRGANPQYIFQKNGKIKIHSGTYNANTYLLIDTSGEAGSIAYDSNGLGRHFLLQGDTTGSAGPAKLGFGSGGTIEWQSTARQDSGSVDLVILRDGAAGTFAIRNGANAQTQRTYGTYTDASNYRRVAMAMTTLGVATLKAEGAGTGSSGNVLHISSLPTSNPGPGILWNNAGTPAIGT